jgi:ribosomal protein L12E/L44/L45/RPP1/RPP2
MASAEGISANEASLTVAATDGVALLEICFSGGDFSSTVKVCGNNKQKKKNRVRFKKQKKKKRGREEERHKEKKR